MRQRIFTDKTQALSFNEQSLTFNGEVLTFMQKGITHFDVNAFTYNAADMGESSIELDMLVDPDLTPAFDKDWYVEFRGERFYLSTLEPSCVKDTSSLKYRYSLIFKSQRDDLKRYEFANIVSVTESVQMPISYDFSLPLTIQEFVERLNINFSYYFGSSAWAAVLDPSYTDNLNKAIYDGVSRVTVDFSRASLWEIATAIYETFGLRWGISSEGGVMTIRIGATQPVLNHTFEYGYENGLTHIERTNPNKEIYTRLSGRGSTRNVPDGYFEVGKDPDANEFTNLIPYTNIMPSSYRDYVMGWNDASAGVPGRFDRYGYMRGYTDTVFNPVDFVLSESAEVLYGVRKGSVEDEEDIYPTFQGQTSATLGRLDEVLAVEAVLNDDYDSSTASSITASSSATAQMNVIAGGYRYKIEQTEAFTVVGIGSIDFTIIQSCVESSESISYSSDITVKLVDASGSVYDSESWSPSWQDSEHIFTRTHSFADVPAGSYRLKLTVAIDNTSLEDTATIVTELTSISESSTTPYSQTFDVWMKNVFDSSQNSGESDDDYMHRIWDPLLSTGGDLTVYFSDGLLAGDDYAFKVAKESNTDNYFIYKDTSVIVDGTPSHWRLSLLKSDAELEATDLMLPNMTQNASVGDHFFFVNINMPHTYILDAESRVESFLENELKKATDEDVSYTIKPSSIFLDSFAQNASIGVGVGVKIANTQILGESVEKTLYVQNLSIQYSADRVLPAWTISVYEKPSLSKSTINLIKGDIKVLSKNTTSASEMAEQVTVQLDSRFLRKDGPTQISNSPTTFNQQIVTKNGIKSDNYLQGAFGGTGYAIYKDQLGNSVLEIDKLNVRRTFTVNELVINQVTAHGGIQIYSAASMIVSKVEYDSNDDVYLLYFDIKGGTVLNQFSVNDGAYCQRFTPDDNTRIKYYWKKIIAVGPDYIVITTASGAGYGDGMVGVPEVGDVVAQLGNTSNISRQSALIIDQTNGGSVTQYAGINNFSLQYKDMVSFGVDPSTGVAYSRVYGDSYTGQRNHEIGNQVSFDSSTGQMKIRGTISQQSKIETYTGDKVSMVVNRGDWYYAIPYFPGDVVQFEGASYICHTQCPAATVPTNTTYWKGFAEKGSDGATINIRGSVDSSTSLPSSGNALWDGWVTDDTGHLWICTALPNTWSDIGQFRGQDGASAKAITLYATAQTFAINESGATTPTAISVYGVTQNTTITSWLYSVNGGAFTSTPPESTSRSGSTVTVESGHDDFKTLTIRATDGVVYDTMTIAVLVDGKSNVVAVLSNEAHTIPANSDGSVSSYVGSGTTIQVFSGINELEYFTEYSGQLGAWALEGVGETGITCGTISKSGKSAIVGNASSMTSDHASIEFGIYAVLADSTEIQLSKIQSFSKSRAGADGVDGVNTLSLQTADRATSVSPTGNAFSKQIVVNMYDGTDKVPTFNWTDVSVALIGLTGSYTLSGYNCTLFLTEFSALTTTVGYINVTASYGGVPVMISISVARVFNPIPVIKGDYSAGTVYTGNCIQRDAVKYTDGNWYALRPTIGDSSTGWVASEWEQLNSFKNVATDTLLAQYANIAGFIYKDGVMISQTGTIGGDASTNYSHPEFVPNIELDGVTGVATMREAIVQGTINASAGIFDGVIGGSGKFTTLTSATNPALKIGLSGSTESFFIEGDALHQGTSSSGNAYRFFGSNIYARGVIGSYEEATVVVEIDEAYYYTFGMSEPPITVSLSQNSADPSAYNIPLYGSTGLIAGFPVNRVIFRNGIANVKYVIIGTIGKRATLINAHDDNNVKFYSRGVVVDLPGGTTRDINFLGGLLMPIQTVETLGYGIVLGPSYDDNW
jgi:hypothetical protein